MEDKKRTRKSREEAAIDRINKVKEEIVELENKIKLKKTELVDLQKRLDDIRTGADKARKLAEQKEIQRLIANSKLSLNEIRDLLSTKKNV